MVTLLGIRDLKQVPVFAHAIRININFRYHIFLKDVIQDVRQATGDGAILPLQSGNLVFHFYRN